MSHLRRLAELVRVRARWVAPIAAIAIVAIVGAVWAIQSVGGPSDGDGSDADPAVAIPTPPPVPEVSLLSDGPVPPLGPLVISFREPPPQQDVSQLVRLDPEPEGQYVWLDDRRLLFQPDYPGLQRGAEYVLHIDPAGSGLAGERTISITVAGKLTVDNVIPAAGDEEVPAEAQILLQFSRAVAPLTTLSAASSAPALEFDPPLPGDGEWLNTSLYRFTPRDMQPSTTYEVRVPAGLTSAADGQLEDDYTWSFTTIQPALATTFPRDSTQFVSRNTEVALTFNQPMDRSSVEAGVSLLNPDPVNVSFTWTEADTTVTLRPSAPLEGSTEYEVVVPAGLLGVLGGETARSRSIGFRTFDPPRVIQTDPGDGERRAGRYGLFIQYNNPMDLESFEGLLTISGIDPDKINVPTIGESPYLDVSAPLQPSTDYSVTIAAGARDRDGQVAPAYSFSFTTGALTPRISLSIPSSTATYSASAEPILYYFATNRDSATFTLHQLSELEALGLIQNQRFDTFRPSGDLIRVWTEQLDDPRDQVRLHSTSLTGEGIPLPRGHYFLSTGTGTDAAKMSFSVVDVALVTKLSLDELLVWAVDYDSGLPLAGVNIEATDPSLDTSRRTDSSGLVSFTVPGPSDPVFNRVPRSYLAQVVASAHSGVTYTDWNNGIWDVGVPLDFGQRKFVGLVYSDRPIYRPGENVFFKGVLRLDDDARYSIPETDPQVVVILRDARGDELLRDDVRLNDFGTFVGELQLPDQASTGSYSIVVEQADGQGFIAFRSFIVAEFRTPEFSVDVRTSGENFVDGETVPTTVSGTFFFGGAVSDARVIWAATGNPTSIRVEGFERYSFVDFDFFRSSGTDVLLRAEGTAETDAAGEARFAVPAALQGREGTHSLQISATVIDQNDRAVAGSATVTVHPADYYVGIAGESRVASTGEPTTLRLVTVDHEGELLPNSAARVEVYQREWVTAKEQTSSGISYRSEPVDTLLATIPTTTGDDAEGSVSFTPPEPGTLRVVAVATDAQGRVARSATFLWVSGPRPASWRIRNDDVIELVADQEQYQVGDTAEVLVPAPFPGATALVTIERGKIISRQIVTFEGNSERISIPIRDEYLPNVFVGVVLYRAPTADDPLPRYNVGYVELSVSTEARVLLVDVEPRVDRASPGDTVTYDVTVTDTNGSGQQAELSVAIVDAAVLSLAEEVGPDGLRAFWFQRGLNVRTGSSLSVSVDRLNDLTREADTGLKGGGGARLRQNFQNTALWEGQLVTDSTGRATFEAVMPDNLTTWRAQARAVSGDTMVGEGTSELLVTQPLLLRPALPRFLRVGDSSTLRLLVRNGTTQSTSVDVVMEAEGVQIQGELERSGNVAADSSILFEWPAQVTEEGTARITFRASSDDGSEDAVLIEIPIYLDVTPETTATGGVVSDSPMVEAIFLPEFAITDKGGLEVSVQASLVGALDDELRHFSQRALEYVEPKASRLIATLGAARARGTEAEIVASPQVRADIAFLIATQRSDGGWAWCRLCQTNVTITAWALTALGAAQAAGADIDASVSSRASFLIDRRINRTADVLNPVNPNETAALLFALSIAAAGNADSTAQVIWQRHEATMRSIVRDDRAQLTNWGRAYLLRGLLAAGAAPDETELRILLNDITAATIASANGNHWEDDPIPGSMHNANVRISALVLHALSEVDLEHPLIEESVRWLSVARTAQGWTTDLERAQAIAALGAFAGATGELSGAYDYDVTLDGSSLLSGFFEADSAVSIERVTVPLDELVPGQVSLLSLLRDFDDPGRMYYGLNLRYVTPAQSIESLNRGFAIAREYSLLDDPDRRVSEVPLGEVVRVRLTIVTPADRKFVTVEDFLPAGLEPIDPQLDIVSPDVKARLEEERREAVAANAPEYAAPWFRWYFNPWDHVDVRDDRVTLYADELPKGVHEYVFFMRATSPGDYFAAPAHVEETFFPEVFGRSDSERLTIVAAD